MKVTHLELYHNLQLITKEDRVLENAKSYVSHNDAIYCAGNVVPRILNLKDRFIALIAALRFKLMALFYQKWRPWGDDCWSQFRTGIKAIQPYGRVLAPDLRINGMLDALEDRDVHLMKIFTNRLKNLSVAEFVQFVDQYGGEMPSTLILSGDPGINDEWLIPLKKVKKLETLSLSTLRTGVTPDGLKALKDLPLKHLSIEGGGEVKDEHLHVLKDLPELESLTIAMGFSVEGHFLAALTQLKKLKKLNISGSEFLDKAVIIPLLKTLNLDELTLPHNLRLRTNELREIRSYNPSMEIVIKAP
jgi:hypothetical protein